MASEMGDVLGMFWYTEPVIEKPVIEKAEPLKEAWRNIDWGGREKELKWLNSFSLKTGTKKHLRILLCGPSGSGKSSFINSVDSVCQNRITSPATASCSGGSFTVTYKTHQIQKENKCYPFVFNDVMGLEGDKGVCEEDIKHAMQGHLNEGYKFNPTSALQMKDEYYNKTPDRNDTADILVCVVSMNAVSILTEDTLNRMRRIRTAARDCDIPQIAILTQIDEACPLVKESIKNVYKSKYIKKTMVEFQSKLGFPLNSIFPVKNYHEEQDLNDDINMLILRALKQIIQIANDHVNKGPELVE